MDNVRHLYTVLAIMGFVSLPVIMNAEKILPGEVFQVRYAEPFNVDMIFPPGRRMAPAAPAASADSQAQPVSGRVEPAASLPIPQRWIDGPMGVACKRAPAKPVDAKAKQQPAAEPCLIV